MTPPPNGAPSDPGFRRALVIANPVSGKGRAARAAQELTDGLQARGIAARLFLTGATGDAFTHLRTLGEPLDLVVSVGGDGTLREVLEGLVDPDTPVGMLPYGTANVLAKELELPRDVHHCLEILERGRVVNVDVARANGKLSLLMTGVGFDAEIVRELARRRRGPITQWSYVAAIGRTLRRYRPPRLSVSVDGRPLAGEHGFVLVSNARNYGGHFHLAARARMDDGELEAYLFPTGSRRELVRAFGRAWLGHLDGGAVRCVRAREITVGAVEPTPFQVDGDPGGETPVEIRLAPNRYRLVVP